MKLMKPWLPGERIRSPWGYRTHPITGKRKLHRGVDVAYDGPIYAPADGVVAHKGADLNKRSGGGYVLILRHTQPRVWTVYYHMREPSHLLRGTRVRRGEVIGHTGTTGASTGVHLHFETRSARRWGSDFDPTTILSSDYAAEHPPGSAHKPQEPVSEPPARVRKRMPRYGISGRLKAMDVRAVGRFMRGRR